MKTNMYTLLTIWGFALAPFLHGQESGESPALDVLQRVGQPQTVPARAEPTEPTEPSAEENTDSSTRGSADEVERTGAGDENEQLLHQALTILGNLDLESHGANASSEDRQRRLGELIREIESLLGIGVRPEPESPRPQAQDRPASPVIRAVPIAETDEGKRGIRGALSEALDSRR